jgi:eukaryotic-like serine/threonine-protein kinase
VVDPWTPAMSVREGDVIAGKYLVERVLGAGGMGVVVAARHLELDDSVAIKFLRPEIAGDGDVVARFLAEARAARRLKTEHVAKVSDIGTLPETGAPYMVMELLEGSDLSALLKKSGPLPAEVAVEYMLQACSAIADAHSNGIVHRDLKPANLFLTHRVDGSSCIKVLDFGIAKIGRSIQGSPASTRTNAMMGTVFYAAPEQLQSAKQVDNRCDIWSLGVTLYELLTARFPFDGDDLGMLIGQILSVPHVPLLERVPGIPPGLARAVDRALEKSRDNRWSDVFDFAEAIAPFGGGDGARSLHTIKKILNRQGAPSAHAYDAGARPGAWTPTTLSPTGASEPGRDASRSGSNRALGLWAMAGAVAALLAMGVVLLQRSAASPPPPLAPRAGAAGPSGQAVALPPTAQPIALPEPDRSANLPAAAPSASAAPVATEPAKPAPRGGRKAGAAPKAGTAPKQNPAATDDPFGSRGAVDSR